MLVLYLERSGRAGEVDFREILHGLDHSYWVDDPREYLMDLDNWVPYEVLRRLMCAVERATGDLDATYHAAREYFKPGHVPSLLEVIVTVLGDVEKTLLHSTLWAGGFGNYINLQCLKATASGRFEILILSRFGPGAMPARSSINMLRGNYEGFTNMFDSVEDVRCVEELSQLKVETVVSEFKGYSVKEEGGSTLVIRDGSDRPVVKAVPITLGLEEIEFDHELPPSGDELIVPVEEAGQGGGRLRATVLCRSKGASKEVDGGGCVNGLVIEEGGTVGDAPHVYTFKEGEVYNAPYSRFRYQWKEAEGGDKKGGHRLEKAEMVPILFKHLRGMRKVRRSQLNSAITTTALARENEELRSAMQSEFALFGMVGRSEEMRVLIEKTRQLARVDSTVLIEGETGTGKELLARAIHDSGKSRKGRFVAINCAALPETLLEAELFGYEKGAFTGAGARKKGLFEAAGGGTLFLDEVGDVSPAVQAKLLRVLEERTFRRVGGIEDIPVDVRVISATNRELVDLVKEGAFREDLYYRLHVISLVIPPLRERSEDLVPLVGHFIKYNSEKLGKKRPVISKEALSKLASHPWPGNIRELGNVIENAIVLDMDGVITGEDISLPPMDQDAADRDAACEDQAWSGNFHDSVETFKRSVIKKALASSGGNQTRAAKSLGLQRTYLSRLIRQLKVAVKKRID